MGAECISYWTPFAGARAQMMQVRGQHRITKKSRNKKFKNIPKRNLPNVGMGGWIEALADKVHKQGELCYTVHKQGELCYTEISITLGSLPTYMYISSCLQI